MTRFTGEKIGSVIGETSPTQVLFIVEDNNARPRLGEYVVVDYGESYSGRERYVLGMIEYISSGNPLAPESLNNPEAIDRLRLYDETYSRTYMRGSARLLSYVSTLVDGNPYVETPKTPPPPFSIVYRAGKGLLEKIFSSRKPGWIRIGVLASHPDVAYHVNVNYIVQRHLAILAVTGAGKSNTVALLVSRIVGELNGTVLIFDMHSEYVNSDLGVKTNIIEPFLNPLYMDKPEFIQLLRIPSNAWKQEYVLRKALDEFQDKMRDSGFNKQGDFIEVLKEHVKRLSGGDLESAKRGVENRIEDFKERYGHILRYDIGSDLVQIIKPGYLNIVDLGSVDEDTADVIVHHYLRRLYYERRRFVRTDGSEGYPVPVFIVLEEAHILVPRSGNTLSKYWVSRIAREGRKFGLGLCLVSQRPKAVDENALSQTNNKIILRLVEPSDLRYVQSASEYLSDELLRILPGLNIGEAVVLGLMTPLPAIVRIDKCRGKSGGRDIDVVNEWRKSVERQARGYEEVLRDSLDLAGL